jgi:uncharacterized protein
MNQRLNVESESDGTTCRAWLYLPTTTAPAPVIVTAHGFGGIREMRLDAFAAQFSQAVATCPSTPYRRMSSSRHRSVPVNPITTSLQESR